MISDYFILSFSPLPYGAHLVGHTVYSFRKTERSCFFSQFTQQIYLLFLPTIRYWATKHRNPWAYEECFIPPNLVAPGEAAHLGTPAWACGMANLDKLGAEVSYKLVGSPSAHFPGSIVLATPPYRKFFLHCNLLKQEESRMIIGIRCYYFNRRAFLDPPRRFKDYAFYEGDTSC